MSVWLNRAGSDGEYESKFLDDKKIYLTWSRLNINLLNIKDKNDLYVWYEQNYDESHRSAINSSAQIWKFVNLMKIGDIIVLPSKRSSTIHFAKILSECKYNEDNEDIYKYYRDVEWFAIDIPRTNFDQDLLYSFGAFSTICEIKRNNAEARIKKMMKNEWNTVTILEPNGKSIIDKYDEDSNLDIEQFSLDLIAKFIERKLKGYPLQNLIAGILQAKGYQTYVSSEGTDNGVDILAGRGELGFSSPSICVQVKSTNSAVDRPTLDQLIGTMNNFNAEFGILVSWTGFKHSVEKERGKQFFKVRLWDQNTIIKELFDNYDKLNEEIKSMVPLKKIWILTKNSI